MATETEMGTDRTEELVSRFRDYLAVAPDDIGQPPEKMDLFSLYNEIKALKNEVKIESRHIKQGFVNMQETLEQRGKDRCGTGGLEEKSRPEMDILLDGIIDLYDRIHASIRALPEPVQHNGKKEKKSFWSGRRRKEEKEQNARELREQEMIASMRAGQQMLLTRIIGLLLAWDITPVAALNQRFDPHTMRALGTDTLPELDDGTVSAEIRTGFQQQDRVLRLADVQVNRL